jgi:beta-lactamase class A
MNILALVDEGKLALNQKIEVLPRDVWAGVSNIATRWATQRRFQLGEMIELMVAKSDDTAVETLFRIGGERACHSGAIPAMERSRHARGSQ